MVAHALQAEMEMITHSNKTGHESVARSPAGRQEGHPRIERSVPILKEREFTDDTTADAINSREARWHEYNLGLKPMMNPFVDWNDVYLRHLVTMNQQP